MIKPGVLLFRLTSGTANRSVASISALHAINASYQFHLLRLHFWDRKNCVNFQTNKAISYPYLDPTETNVLYNDLRNVDNDKCQIREIYVRVILLFSLIFPNADANNTHLGVLAARRAHFETHWQ